MRLNTFFTVTVVLASMFSLASCDKVAAITGGPADGHDLEWYETHYAEAKTEADYCIKKYQGPNATSEDLAKAPNFCSAAIRATKIHQDKLQLWAINAANCKIHPSNANNSSTSCHAIVSLAKEVDTSSKEAQYLLEKNVADLKKLAR